MDELKERFFHLFIDYINEDFRDFDADYWPKVLDIIEQEKAKAIAEYRASLNVKYSPEQTGQRGPDDMNFNPLISEENV